MRIARLTIENFKGIEKLEHSFEDELGRIRPVTLVLGDNGSGKTSMLQAIALVLSLATSKTKAPKDLGWPGLLPERIGSRGATRVELEMVLEDDELSATRELFAIGRYISRPVFRSRVRLLYEHGNFIPEDGPPSEFQGRWLIHKTLQTKPEVQPFLRRVGDVFWFHQNRNVQTVADLRDELIRAWAYKTSPRGRGAGAYLDVVERQFAELFPGTRFYGAEPRMLGGEPNDEEGYFLLEREGRIYDIAEMSSGEQAVFPLLYEFARRSIARSVVLIDELELHLHPPQQQALMTALRRIGPDCQFIVTSHSSDLEAMTPDEEELRLPGGRRCL